MFYTLVIANATSHRSARSVNFSLHKWLKLVLIVLAHFFCGAGMHGLKVGSSDLARGHLPEAQLLTVLTLVHYYYLLALASWEAVTNSLSLIK